MKTILSLWLCGLTVAFGWTPTDRSFDTNVFLPIGYVFYLKTNAIAAMAGGVSGGLGTTNGASTNVGAFLKTTATTQYWSFNGVGLTNLSIPLASVTNAGTAGYSNAGAYVLSRSGSATNLTIRSNVVIHVSSLESNSIIGPTDVGITYLFRSGLVRLTNSVTLDWIDFNDGLKIGSQSSANSATISLDALTGLPKFTGLTASRATVTGSDGYLASSATTGTQVGYLSDVTGLIQAQIDGKTTSSDTAFGSSWNGVTTIAPSKNAVYDWAHTFDTDDDGKVNVLDQDVGIPITDLNGVLQTPITTSAGLASALADESGSGVVVYSTGGSLTNFITRPSTIGSVAQNILWKTGMTTNIWQIYVEDGTPGFVAYVNPSGFGVFPYGLFVGSLGSGATSYFTNNLAVGGALATIGTQTNTGAASFGSSVMVGGALNVAGGGAITGAVAHLSTFTNTGVASFASTVLVGGNETIAGTLSVTGAVNHLSTFTNTGAASLASTLLVGGAEAVAGALSVTGAVSHLSTVTNTGASSFAGAAMFGGAVNMAGALSVTNVGPTKIMGTDSGAKVVGAALSGLTWDGTTLTASGGSAATFDLTQFGGPAGGTNLIVGFGSTNGQFRGISETNDATHSWMTITNTSITSSNGGGVNRGVYYQSNTAIGTLTYSGSNSPFRSGSQTAIANEAIGGTNQNQWDVPGMNNAMGIHTNGSVWLNGGLTNNGATRLAGAVTTGSSLTTGGAIATPSGSSITLGGTAVASAVTARYFADLSNNKGYVDTGVSGIGWQLNNTASGSVPLQLKLLSGTTVDAFQIANSAGLFLLRADVSGNLYVSNTITVTNGISAPIINLVKASSYTLTVADIGKRTVNTGATSQPTYTLPPGVIGMHYLFYCDDADGIKVLAVSSDTIRDGSTVSAAAGYIDTTSIGAAMDLEFVSANHWAVVSKNGTWNAPN